MSRRTRPAAPPISPRANRFTLIYAADEIPWTAGYAKAIADALANGLDLEFRFGRADAVPWFRLRAFCGVIHVLSANYAHLGTMASVEAALVRGWQVGGGF